MTARRLLYVTPVLPLPADQGSRLFLLETARILRQLGEVSWITRLLPGQRSAAEALRREGFDLHLDESFASTRAFDRLRRRIAIDLRALRLGRPRELAFCSTPEVQRLVARCHERHPDALGIAAFWSCWSALKPMSRERRVLLLSDLEFRRLDEARELGLASAAQVARLRTAEYEAIRHCGRILTISPEDLLELRASGEVQAESTALWPVRVELPRSRASAERTAGGLLIYGRWEADFNRDGLEWWLREHWPRIRRELPDHRLRVAGSGISARMRALLTEQGVEVLGWVEDLEAELAAAQAVLIPLRYGGGVRYRLLEALAHRAPCICSPVAARGSGAVAGRDYLEASDSEQWLAAVRVTSKPLERQRLASAGRSFVEQEFEAAKLLSRARAALGGDFREKGGGSR